jgi:hypothetical protein
LNGPLQQGREGLLYVGAGYAGDGVAANWLSPLKRLPHGALQKKGRPTFAWERPMSQYELCLL